MAAKLLAGASEVAITPPVGVPLLGALRPSTGVHDDLFARALVLTDGAESIALVCLDLVGLDFALADELRDEVKRQTDIATTLLNCTHTHSAPFTIPWSVQGWEDFQRSGRPWQDELVAKVTGAVHEAATGLHTATLRFGQAPVQVGFNRRLPINGGGVTQPNPQGAVVPWVDVLRADAADGTPVAILFSHAAHPVIVHAASTLISADYCGYATATVRQRLGGHVVAMFAQACGGNINGEPLRGGFEAAECAGTALGEAAVQAASGADTIAASELRTSSVTIQLPFQDVPSVSECEGALREAEGRFARSKGEASASELEVWAVHDEVLRLRDLLGKAKEGAQQALRFDINAVMVGAEWCLLAMTHELFAEYQLWADQVSPFRRTMVLAYTNGCEGYLPTDADFALGGYEAAAAPANASALAYRNRLALRPGVEAQVKDAIAGLRG